ncbi:MAG: hypothetical protein K0S86_4058 [Geminicoccaceae bacterium]|nr:hypothetical protein [Geminicoccaceae bacterium]
MSIFSRLRNAFRSDAVSDEIDREMAFHIEQRTDDLVAAGMSPGRARAEARRRFGIIGKHSEDTRNADVVGWFASLLADVRYAVRGMRSQPGPTFIVGLTLAFGLGVNAAVLGIVDGLLLRPYQFRNYDRLVVLWDTRSGTSATDVVAPANFLDWRTQVRNVEHLVAWEGWDVTLIGSVEPERLNGFRVSPGFFELLGVRPTLGRWFAADEERPGNDRRVVISDGFWKRRFGSDSTIIGKELVLDDVAHTIVGIAPPNFDFPMACDVWAPLALAAARASERSDRSLTVMGKLAHGASLKSAQAEMSVIAQRLAGLYPAANRDHGVSIEPLSDAFTEDAAFAVSGILQTAAVLVLLVACANLAGLLLARSIDRRRELAVRVALGASRARIVRQLVTETVVLSLMASAIAIICARVALGALRASVPSDVARQVEGWSNIRLDWAVVWIIPALSIAIGLLVGLFPALTALRGVSPSALRESDRGAIGSIPNLRGRQSLVIAEIAFALTILIVAGLTLRSGARMVDKPGGFDADRLLMLQTTLGERNYGEPAARRRFVAELIDRLNALPGVEDAAAANILPANGWSPATPVLVEDEVVADNAGRRDLLANPGRWPHIGYRSVSENFFGTMGIRVLSGRGFTSADRDDGQPVAVVSASFAHRFWPDRSAIGKRVRLADTASAWLTVVGVVADVDMYNWWDGVDYSAVYVPLRQEPPSGVIYAVVRAHGEPGDLTTAIRAAVRDVDATLPIDQVRTAPEAVAANARGMNLLATMMAVCGGIALLLAVVGIYGLMAYTVTQRTQEFGIRLAFGATAADMLRLTLGRAMRLTAIGLGLGVVLGWMLARAIAAALEGVVALDGTTFVAVAATLAFVSMLSAYLPARRALRMNPATILRQ